MTDIQKCLNGCSKQLLCKRYTAPAGSRRQSYADYKPNPETGICTDYYPNAIGSVSQEQFAHKLINHNED